MHSKLCRIAFPLRGKQPLLQGVMQFNMSYEIIWEKEGVKLTTTGILGIDLFEANLKAATDPRYINAKYAIFDCRKVTDFPMNMNTIRNVADSDTRAYKINPKMKLAIIANESVMIGITNMYKTYFELNNSDKTWQIKLSESELKAREWINA